jgi:hypothetical protein
MAPKGSSEILDSLDGLSKSPWLTVLTGNEYRNLDDLLADLSNPETLEFVSPTFKMLIASLGTNPARREKLIDMIGSFAENHLNVVSALTQLFADEFGIEYRDKDLRLVIDEIIMVAAQTCSHSSCIFCPHCQEPIML